mmetsp:Transcript_1161/g.2631  ORF Transcript_1161/g.2631 Transcript_1161/m.2631 type:complete len:246 (+) Transcript_1161:923-1660(+)
MIESCVRNNNTIVVVIYCLFVHKFGTARDRNLSQNPEFPSLGSFVRSRTSLFAHSGKVRGKDLHVLELFHKGPAGRGALPEAQGDSAGGIHSQDRVAELAGQDGGGLHPVRRGHQHAPGRSRRVVGEDPDGDLGRARGGLDGVFRGLRHHKGEVSQRAALDRQRVVGDLCLDDEVPLKEVLHDDDEGKGGRGGSRGPGLEGLGGVQGPPEVHRPELPYRVQVCLGFQLGLRQLVLEGGVPSTQEG